MATDGVGSRLAGPGERRRQGPRCCCRSRTHHARPPRWTTERSPPSTSGEHRHVPEPRPLIAPNTADRVSPTAGYARSVMLDVTGPGRHVARVRRRAFSDHCASMTSTSPIGRPVDPSGVRRSHSRPDHDERMKSRREVDDTLSISDPDSNGAHVRSGEARPSDDVDLDCPVCRGGDPEGPPLVFLHGVFTDVDMERLTVRVGNTYVKVDATRSKALRRQVWPAHLAERIAHVDAGDRLGGGDVEKRRTRWDTLSPTGSVSSTTVSAPPLSGADPR